MKICFVFKKKLLYWFDEAQTDRPIPQVGDHFLWQDELYKIDRRVFDYPQKEIRLLLWAD